ncbi:hypothetical protein HPB48_007504 [Haemaphysalis longicornis]|uniref:Down syndrome cell adhesion molecule n=1 Tax=Haemaphysalis longicornis TaxID=44386 RepID=A0A9J6G5V4_HAELO|nr:hypothetical protein HPB48_007504 [Haemaphysalis longicornis]
MLSFFVTLVPPIWRIEPSDTVVVRGGTAIIDCQADGFPLPRVRWTKSEGDVPGDYRAISSSSRIHVFENGSLAVHSSEEKDSGFFLCQASNGISPILSKVVKLSVHAPGGPPQKVRAEATGSQSIKVWWKPPRKDIQFGPLKGYYVGYKVKDTADTYVYKTLELNPSNLHDECHVTSLKRNTEYSVVVQAFNAKGAGPPSEEIFVKTLKNDPPTSPAVKVSASTSSSISVSWEAADANDLLGYVLHVRKDFGEWNKINVPRNAAEYTVDHLACGASYQIYLSAFNSVGNGGPSNIVSSKTVGVAPVAPDKPSLITVNSTAIAIHLDSWHDGGCPFLAFEVRFRRQKDKVWNVVGHNIPPEQKLIMLNDLVPGVAYLLQVIAKNEAGITEAEYDFVTLQTAQEPATPSLVVESEGSPFYMELGVILPACVSLTVVLVVGVLVYIVLRRRYSSGSSHSGSSAYGSRKGAHLQECLRLSEVDPSLGKKTMSLDGRLDYYPTPYATTRVTDIDERKMSECSYKQVGILTKKRPLSRNKITKYKNAMCVS